MTRREVSRSWDNYQQLVLAAQTDPATATDPLMQLALRRAHQRWSEAFSQWDGR